MRIIVIEDEPRTRNGLIGIIEKYTNYQVVGSETDGQTGLDLVKRLEPDLVISDIRMPNKNGLEMIEDIREAGLQTEVILLTGYSEFEYAKQAIRLDVEEYLLKPLDIEDIMKALRKVEDKIAIKQEKKTTPEQILYFLLQPKLAEEEINKCVQQLKEVMLVNEKQEYLVYLIQPLNPMTKKKEDMKRNIDLIIDELGVEDCLLIQIPTSQRMMLIHPKEINKRYAKDIFEKRVIEKIIEQVDAFFISKTLEDLKTIREAVVELDRRFEFVFDLENDRIWEEEKLEKTIFQPLSYPYHLEAAVKKSIRNGADEKIKKYMRQFEQEIICSMAKPIKRKEYTVRFLLNILEWLRDLRKETEFEQSYNLIISSMLDIQSRELLTYQFFKFVNELFKPKVESKTENGLILIAVDYIRINYNQEITLVTTAEKVGVTPEYLSKLFKQEMGMNFSNFLTQFRLSQSKRLMLETDKKVYEIAEKVGYKDTKYFNKVFKSLNGVSPTEFRRQKG